MQNVNNTGTINSIHFDGPSGDADALISFLTANGLRRDDAKEFADLVKSEKPEDSTEPFGKKAKRWMADNLKKAVDGSWKVGIGTATEVLKKGALTYYGLS